MENTNKEDTVGLRASTGSAYSYAWDKTWQNFLVFFLVAVVLFILEIPSARISPIGEDMFIPGIIILKIFGILYGLFLYVPVDYGAKYIVLKAVRGEEFDSSDVISGFRDYLNVVLSGLLTGAIILVGIIFLIVPGIIFTCRLAFVPYLVMDKKLDAVKAVERSWKMTKGHGWTIFLMGLLAIPIVILGLICLIFGVIISAMWIRAAFASIYHAVDMEEQKQAVAA